MIALAVLVLIFGITFFTQPLVSSGWGWDLLQATGYTVMALWVYLFIDTGRGRPSLHTFAAWLSLALLAVHVVGLIAFDILTAQYLGLEAPNYMLVGLSATGMFILIITFANQSTRRFWHPLHLHFLKYHRIFAWIVLLGAAYHIAASGFYTSGYELVLGGAVLCAVIVLRMLGRTVNTQLNSGWVLVGTVLVISSFMLVRTL